MPPAIKDNLPLVAVAMFVLGVLGLALGQQWNFIQADRHDQDQITHQLEAITDKLESTMDLLREQILELRKDYYELRTQMVEIKGQTGDRIFRWEVKRLLSELEQHNPDLVVPKIE